MVDLDAEFARFEAEIASVAAAEAQPTQDAATAPPPASAPPLAPAASAPAAQRQAPPAAAPPPLRPPPQPVQPPAGLQPPPPLAPPPLAPPPMSAPRPMMPPAPAPMMSEGMASTSSMPYSPSGAALPAYQPPQFYGGMPVPPQAPLGAVSAPAAIPVVPPPAPKAAPVPPPHASNVASSSARPMALSGTPADEATLRKLKADLLQGHQDKKDGKKKEGALRQAAGKRWWDPTLSEWPENDFRIFVGDMGNEVNDELLGKAFSKYPSFAKAKIVRDKRTNKSKGFGFVSFLDSTDMVKALREMDGKYIGNRPCKLSKSSWEEREAKAAAGKRKGGPGGAGGSSGAYVPPKRNKKYHIPMTAK